MWDERMQHDDEPIVAAAPPPRAHETLPRVPATASTRERPSSPAKGVLSREILTHSSGSPVTLKEALMQRPSALYVETLKRSLDLSCRFPRDGPPNPRSLGVRRPTTQQGYPAVPHTARPDYHRPTALPSLRGQLPATAAGPNSPPLAASAPTTPRARPWLADYRRGKNYVEKERLNAASLAFLNGLSHSPHNSELAAGFDTATTLFKTEYKHRWAKWPFHPVEEAEETGTYRRRVLEPPPPIGPPQLMSAEARALEIAWDASADEALKGYEVEAREISPLTGAGPWRVVYKGDRLRHRLDRLAALSEWELRVRPYNKAGEAEWSEPLAAALPEVKEVLEEIAEIPPAWRTINIDDLLKEHAKGGGEAPQRSWHGLVDRMHAHRATLKIAFRFYSLAGSGGSTDEDPDTMIMQQFLNFAKV